ncbi:Late secretory pathway protein AVL9 like [Pseudolycoriella hygida]|uniref:Late secretory pathway protein AVL9 like n=1 Tax=Pseudolycoriella hygida TaxID=35572 RepID=A0A9Q0MVZ0_9DIPT|nr:Late secretory pathway protein AVL9 like [Pseudolycoriella hygida]
MSSNIDDSFEVGSMKSSILHIVVVGFHHKKGCQVEFSYPPLISGKPDSDCPSGWKYLPTLALPDGSHNFHEDSVYFNLPSLTIPNESVYGVSCYRQIAVENLKVRPADVTRSTVQKSVCILSSQPIYGYIEVKLSLIADAYFNIGDFDMRDMLIEAFNQLNSCLEHNITPSIYVGLPIRDILLKWRYKLLILFKLLLLQKRVICFASPVRPMCSLIMVVSSLFPELIQKGFDQVACVRTSRPISPMPNFDEKEKTVSPTPTYDVSTTCDESSKTTKADGTKEISVDKVTTDETKDENKKQEKNSLQREVSVDALSNNLKSLSSVKTDLWNAPIPIFSNGNLCLPYLSLPYMDLLSDPSINSYIIGTSNILFKQKRQSTDVVLIDVDNCTIETMDVDLKRQLTLTTEDLRFVDYIVRHAQMPKQDAEGSQDWIREQFAGYTVAMVRTSLLPDGCKEIDQFNGAFMAAWAKTDSYQEWRQGLHDDLDTFENIQSGHPCSGTLSVADMKLKIAQTMNNSESGRKINQAVNTTSRAVGGALTQAKGAISSWWSAITTQSPIYNEDDNLDKRNADGNNKTIGETVTEGCDVMNDDDTKEEHFHVHENHGGVVEIGREAKFIDQSAI